MSFGASLYHSFTPTPNSFGNRFAPATQFHAQSYTPTSLNRPVAPLNRYAPHATIKTISNNRIVGINTQLKPGTVVEVNQPGHQTELQYTTYSGHLAPLNQSTLNRVPNEIRDQVKRMGGPSYFAHDLHNKFATQGFMSQFHAQDFHGPNRPLI